MEKYAQNTSGKDADKTLNISSDSDKEIGPSRGARVSKSKAWVFFDKSRDGKYAKCRFCARSYRTSGNTTNLFDHLKRFHPTFDKSKNRPPANISLYFKQQGEYPSTSARKKSLDKAFMEMIAEDLQPFSITEDNGFRKFIKRLDPQYVPPARATLRNVHMEELYNEMNGALQALLNEVDYCAITTDCWTSRANEGFLTVTCHFITSSFVLRSANLSTRKLLEVTNHSAENIASSLQSVFDEWGITPKITTIVTDNASVMIKACEILKKKHLPCFAHCLNLVVQDFLAQQSLRPIIEKCKRLVTYFKNSTIAYEKFKAAQGIDKPYSLIQEVPTRWNSAYKMIKRVLNTNSCLSTVLLQTNKTPQPLAADEVDILKDIVQILAPFDSTTIQSSSSSSVTVSLIIPLVNGLIDDLNNLKLSTVEGKKSCSFIICGVKKRLHIYEERWATRLSTILDPRYKKEGFLSSSNANIAATLLENEVATTLQTLQQPITAEPSTSKPRSLNKFMERKLSNKIRTNRSDAIVANRQYFLAANAPQETNPLEYWKVNTNEMPALAKIARQMLCIAATSTESERMFSKAGEIMSDRRAALKAKNLDKLLFINKNLWIQ